MADTALTGEESGRRADVVLGGQVFTDTVFGGLTRFPSPGEEIRCPITATAPGGAANLAVAAARLGLDTTLVAPFGGDANGRFCYDTLAAEGIDLSAAAVLSSWHQPITISLAETDDRRMVTHECVPLEWLRYTAQLADPRAFLIDLHQPQLDADWLVAASQRGSLILADSGFDETGRWDLDAHELLAHCDVFLPNAVEAMSYTHADSPRAAARQLAERIPLVIVTDGANGAWAADAGTGSEVHAAALPTIVVDPTGAGDVFDAAICWATLVGLPLRQRLDLACLCSALAVTEPTGSLGAPGWAELAEWLSEVTSDNECVELAERYEFMADLLPEDMPPPARRAGPSVP